MNDKVTITTRYFWDCECEHDYIHPKNVLYCHLCDTKVEDAPDSRLDEVWDFLRKEG
jgi:hypothetical protein